MHGFLGLMRSIAGHAVASCSKATASAGPDCRSDQPQDYKLSNKISMLHHLFS
jgi:hypothetical protein